MSNVSVTFDRLTSTFEAFQKRPSVNEPFNSRRAQLCGNFDDLERFVEVHSPITSIAYEGSRVKSLTESISCFLNSK